jgi:hypothetical protein
MTEETCGKGRNALEHDKRPFGIGQIAWVTKAASIRGAAMFGCPHGAFLRVSSAQQGNQKLPEWALGEKINTGGGTRRGMSSLSQFNSGRKLGKAEK